MKRLLLVAAFIVASVGALAQGTVNMNNTPQAGVNAPVFDTDGKTGLAGTAYLAQLYAGPNASSLAPIGAAVPFLSGAGAGFFRDATARVIASVAAGGVATVVVKAWDATAATYEAAVTAKLRSGFSNTFTVTTGGGGVPPGPPANLVGMTSFSLTAAAGVIPEPSTVALALLGAAALLLRRKIA